MAHENKRWEFLKRQVELNERARRVETFIDDYTKRYPEGQLPPPCRQSLEWARQQAGHIHAIIAPDQLTVVLEKHKLMDDATEIASWVTFD